MQMTESDRTSPRTNQKEIIVSNEITGSEKQIPVFILADKDKGTSLHVARYLLVNFAEEFSADVFCQDNIIVLDGRKHGGPCTLKE